MKFITGWNGVIPEYKNVVWADHYPGCEKCRGVDLEKTASYVNACAEGSPLLMEELTKRQSPIVRQKAQEVKDWARKAGVFKGV
jgi:hypothetical protein